MGLMDLRRPHKGGKPYAHLLCGTIRRFVTCMNKKKVLSFKGRRCELIKRQANDTCGRNMNEYRFR